MAQHRSIQDASLLVTKFLPAAGANNNTAGIDIGVDAFVVEEAELRIRVPATPALADAKSITFTVQDSADNAAFTSLGITFTVTGAGGVGAAAQDFYTRLPANTRRYVGVNQAVAAAGGDSTGVSVTVALLL